MCKQNNRTSYSKFFFKNYYVQGAEQKEKEAGRDYSSALNILQLSWRDQTL